MSQLNIPGLVIAGLLETKDLCLRTKSIGLHVHTHGAASITETARMTGMSWNTTARALRQLERLQWVKLTGEGRALRPVPWVPGDIQSRIVERFDTLYDLAPARGEFLMKCYCELRIDSQDFVHNARPGFLLNEKTGERLEYDMWYRSHRFALEFNGVQHLGEATPYISKAEADRTRRRDKLKVELSKKAGVRLIVVTASTVTPAFLEELIPREVPRRPLDFDGPFYKELWRLGAHHGSKAARGSGGGDKQQDHIAQDLRSSGQPDQNLSNRPTVENEGGAAAVPNEGGAATAPNENGAAAG